MRWSVVVGPLLLTASLACGDGQIGLELIQTRFEFVDAHDPDNSSLTVAVRLGPAPSSGGSLTLELLDSGTEEVVKRLQIEAEGHTACGEVVRGEGVTVFSLRGPAAETVAQQMDSFTLRLTVDRNGALKRFLFDFLEPHCYGIE